MEKLKMTEEDLNWITENPKEITDELIRKSELIKNFSNELESYRKNNDRIGYNKLFKVLLKKEEDKQWKKD
jgi:hypothetical protein